VHGGDGAFEELAPSIESRLHHRTHFQYVLQARYSRCTGAGHEHVQLSKLLLLHHLLARTLHLTLLLVQHLLRGW
jgi:hypothetical protein